MNEQVDTAEYEFLWKLLANPADPNHSYIFNLQSLVADYPQSGVLRALLMPNGDKRHLKHAAAYFNPRTLHKLATAPDSLPKVSQDQIVFSGEPETIVADTYFSPPITEAFVPPVVEEIPYTPVIDDSAEEVITAEVVEPEIQDSYNTFSESHKSEAEPVVDSLDDDTPAYIGEDDEPEQSAASYYQEVPAYSEDQSQAFTPASENNIGTAIEEDFVHDEIAEAPIVEPVEALKVSYSPVEEEQQAEESLAKQYDTYIAESEAAPTEPVSSYEDTGDRYFHQPIEDEVYDEIVSIEDIGLEQLAILNKSVQDGGENYFVFEPEIAESVNTVTETPVNEPEADASASDESTKALSSSDLHPAVVAESPGAKQGQGFDAKKDVSMYHDETMPYSFMWWLDKTRKQHADIYQPYAKQTAPRPEQVASPKNTVPAPPPLDELQKQYYQNIVSNTAFADLNKAIAKAPAIGSARKEDKIIERFIQEEPHIKHPAEVKLDNENKAKNSSEDKEELVTETLARIYTEQMLYHKAVLTYKKLMLKYPEKSLYFAGQIEQLENKIN